MIATGFVYVAVILDAWSRRVVGFAIGRSLDAGHAVAAFERAVALRWPLPGCVVHTDPFLAGVLVAVVLSTAGTLSEAHNAQKAPLRAVTNQIDPEAGLHDHPAPRAVSAAIWRYPGREEVKAIILAYFPNGPACPMTRMARAMTQGDGEYERRLWRSMRKATWKLKSSRTIHPTSSLTSMADACVRQMYRLATSAKELLN